MVKNIEVKQEPDVDTAAPFFKDLHAVLPARANGLQQSQVEIDFGIVKGRKRLNDGSEDQSSGELAAERKAGSEKRQKVRVQKEDPVQPVTNVNVKESIRNGIQEIMRKFMQQQEMIDREWRAAMEKCAEERERLEKEWQQRMERLKQERVMMEQAWREKEEERERDERREEQRDALLTALLIKVINRD